MPEYEIELDYVCKKKPAYVKTEYGFGTNPPIVVHAKSKTQAIEKLRLPKCVKVKNITAWRDVGRLK
jgi:hypothetical protein